MKVKSVQSINTWQFSPERLGLADVIHTIYDIVKAYGVELKVETADIEGRLYDNYP